MTGFKPQGTTMDTFSKTEKNLYEQFKSFGYSQEVSKAIAYSFTQYMLNYLTEEGVARRISDSGADARTVLSLVNAFRQAKQTSHERSPLLPAKDASPSFCQTM